MEMKGEYRIPASRETVWQALNDPDVLRACIPGCQELERTSETSFAATVKTKVGPVSATFKGEVELEDIDPPAGYRIQGEGKGGVAGFAKGGASVRLAEDGAETVLTYDAEARVGGKLAQIGSRLIAGTARKLADQFSAILPSMSRPAARSQRTDSCRSGRRQGLSGQSCRVAGVPSSRSASLRNSSRAARSTMPGRLLSSQSRSVAASSR